MGVTVANGRRRRGWARKLAAEWLLSRIRDGQLTQGQRIPSEPELVALLGVGRSSVREAVQGLVAAGMLEIRPGTGTYVRAVGTDTVLSPVDVARRLAPTSVLDLLELNTLLEAGIVDLATKRATDDDLLAVERAIEFGTRTLNDPNGFADFLEHYRLALAAATHNGALLQMTTALNSLLRHRRVTTAAAFAPGDAEASLAKRQQVLGAIRRGQLQEARTVAHSLAEEARHDVLQEAHSIIRQDRERTADDQRSTGARESASL
jgi:DNA-binding FadR family transcriptional regulator